MRSLKNQKNRKMFHLLNHLHEVLSLQAKHIWNMLHLPQLQASPNFPKKEMLPKKKTKKYECKACPKKIQRTSGLRDHNFTVHLKMTYDCAECLKCYQTKKALAHHNKTVHSGIGTVKCTQENCQWQSKEVGSLYQHLLEVHGIGEPIVCNVVTPSGQKSSKVFKNTRSFQAHASFHMQRQFKCELCAIILLPRNKLKPMLGSTTRRLKQEKSISVIYVGKYLTMNLFYTITECFTNLPTTRNCKNRPKDKRLPNHPEGQLHPPRKLQLLFSLHLHQKNLLHLVNNQGHPQPNQTYFL